MNGQPNPYTKLHARARRYQQWIDRGERIIWPYLAGCGLAYLLSIVNIVTHFASKSVDGWLMFSAMAAFLFFAASASVCSLRAEATERKIDKLFRQRCQQNASSYQVYVEEFKLAYDTEPDIRDALDKLCGFTLGEQGELVDGLETDSREMVLSALIDFAYPAAWQYGRSESRRRLTAAPVIPGTRAAEIAAQVLANKQTATAAQA